MSRTTAGQNGRPPEVWMNYEVNRRRRQQSAVSLENPPPQLSEISQPSPASKLWHPNRAPKPCQRGLLRHQGPGTGPDQGATLPRLRRFGLQLPSSTVVGEQVVSLETPPPQLSEVSQPFPGGPVSGDDLPAFEALVMSNQQLENVVSVKDTHPLLQVQAQAELDRRCLLDALQYNSGSWDGRWTLLCERKWRLREELGLMLPTGVENEVLAAQAPRREFSSTSWTKR